MNSCLEMNILEPIDPLNISFSEDKCVKTPETIHSQKNTTKEAPRILVKDPSQLFGYQKPRRYTESKPKSPLNKAYCQTATKYETVYISPRRPRLEIQHWRRGYSCYKPAQPIKNIGKVSTGEHLKQINKLESLIRRINDRIEVSKKYIP